MQNLPSLEITDQFKEFTVMLSFLITNAWWAILLAIFFLAYYFFFKNQQKKYGATIDHTLLAVSVPEDSEKSPKSMEQVLAGLHGIFSPPNFVEKWFLGEYQTSISLELVGINGHVRFIFRTPDKLRDTVEAHIYAQYPDAEIIEVEDYTKFIPDNYPNDQYELYGCDFELMEPDPYPIRTYMQFAEEFDKGFIDPIAAFTEVMSKLSVGEQIWIQFIIKPIPDKWKEEGIKIVAKLIGKKTEIPEDLFMKTIVKGWHSVLGAVETALQIPPPESAEQKREQETLMQYLSPGEQDIVQSIERNITKVGFATKFRYIYVAKKDVYNKARGIISILGAINLLHTQNLNWIWFNLATKTKVDYFKYRIPGRQRRIIKNYKKRDLDSGAKSFIFSIEELATIYHFPYISVESPSIVSAKAGKAGPPADLPTGR